MFPQNRTRLRVWLIIAAVAGMCAPSPAADQREKITVDPAHCTRLSDAQKQWLTPEWQRYLEYTRICAIGNRRSETALFLVSVHADLYYKSQPGQPVHQVTLPNPLLFLPSGDVLGSLPYNFPDDPPAELRVTFTQWEQGFPERIELYLTDPRAAGSRPLPPLRWNAAQRKFLSPEEMHHE
jgi:hypothetical protein